MPHYLFFPTLAAVLQGMNPAEDFFVTTDAFLETPTLYKRNMKSDRNFTEWCSCQWNFMPNGTHLPPRCPWFVDVLFRFCGLIRPGFGSRITNQGYYNRTHDGWQKEHLQYLVIIKSSLSRDWTKQLAKVHVCRWQKLQISLLLTHFLQCLSSVVPSGIQILLALNKHGLKKKVRVRLWKRVQ